MANLHPSSTPISTLGVGSYRERDVLNVIEEGLPQGFDVFHNVNWSETFSGNQHHGEIDIVLVSPSGHILLIEVKSGSVNETEYGLTKRYSSRPDDVSDIGSQVRRQHSAILSRLERENIKQVNVDTLLVLPDHQISSPIVAYPPERIIDAKSFPELCMRIQHAIPKHSVDARTRERVLDFLKNRFSVVPDVSAHIGQIQRTSISLASGLATWVPAIEHKSGVFVIVATAGSGKTQLAQELMSQAQQRKQRCLYMCFNRALADHMASIAPQSVVVMTFHEACVEHARKTTGEPDFAEVNVYQNLANRYVAGTQELEPYWDVVILDETQDFEPQWVESVLIQLKDAGKAYLMGDPSQQVYERDAFEVPDAVRVHCMDNFRSPRKVVDAINLFQLTEKPIISRSAFVGDSPGFMTYATGEVNVVTAVQNCIKTLVAEGVQPSQIAVLTFAGQKRSAVLAEEKLAGLSTRRFTGSYDSAGNALWTKGDLLVDTVYRFKGQSAPVVVLCEVDFQEISARELRKLFVGMTRGQFRVECVLSDRAAQLLMARIE